EMDTATGASGRLALQDAANLADLANIPGRHRPNDGPAVGQQVDDADAAQGDERLADGRVTNAEAFGKFLRDQALSGPQFALEDVRQQRLDNGLATQAMIAVQRVVPVRSRHGESYREGKVQLGRKAGARLSAPIRIPTTDFTHPEKRLQQNSVESGKD